MTGTLAILWTIDTELHTGQLKVGRGGLELRSRRHSLSVPFESIAYCAIDRAPAARIRGLPVLRLELAQKIVLRIASLESVTALSDLLDRLAVAVSA